MDTDVYFICPKCKGLTNGTGSRDTPFDQIFCGKCKEGFSSRKIGTLKPYFGKEVQQLPLYAEKTSFQMLIEE